MEEIQKSFATGYHLKESVKVAYFDNNHVYLNFANKVDYNHILFKNFIHFGDSLMKVLKCSSNIKLEKETPIAPVWILIHQLPWNLFLWDVISRMLNSVGAAIASYMAIYFKSRGNVAKIKVEIDLLKSKQYQIWLEYNRMDDT